MMKTKTKTKTWRRLAPFLLLLLCCALFSCASFKAGPISEPIIGVGAAMLAALDQLLASGLLSPEQHAILHAGIRDIAIGTAQAAQGVQNLGTRLDAVQAETGSAPGAGTITAVGGAVTAVGVALQRLIRGPAAPADEQTARAVKHAQSKAERARKRITAA
jgi:hypothetical protein